MLQPAVYLISSNTLMLKSQFSFNGDHDIEHDIHLYNKQSMNTTSSQCLTLHIIDYKVMCGFICVSVFLCDEIESTT